MKLAKNIIAGLFLLTLVGGGSLLTVNAQEITTPIKAERIACNKAVLSRSGENLTAQFLVQGIPQYNKYKATVGNVTLDGDKTDLRTIEGQLASWLIVVDVSDPRGRAKAIRSSAAVAARLVSLMSKGSNVRIMALAGSQKVVAEADQDSSTLSPIMSEGQLNNTPIMQMGRGDKIIGYGTPHFQLIVESLMSATEVQMDNTYLWIGLSRALKEQMPSCSRGAYKNMPRGVILISDGVDESNGSAQELNNLIATANKLEIPIHTIAFPFKDTDRDETRRHQGFGALQKLANDTNGGFLNYAADIHDPNHPACIAKMEALLRRTSASVMQLTTPIGDIPAASTMRVTLHNGMDVVGTLTVPQDKVGTVVADAALQDLYNLSIDAQKSADTRPLVIGTMRHLFAEKIMPLRNYEELFETTRVNADFAIRVHEFLQHIDRHDALRSNPNIATEAVECMLDYKRPLPEPPKNDTHVTAHVQSTATVNGGGSGSSAYIDEYEEDTFKSWVWWTLGIGGASFFGLIFMLIIRTLTRSGEYEPTTVEEDDDIIGIGTAPVLATLVDINNPGRSWDINKPSVSVGRGQAADIKLPSDHVSTLHFSLDCDATGQWTIKDNNSTNGTEVNGTRIATPTPIKNGDTITLADLELAFRLR